MNYYKYPKQIIKKYICSEKGQNKSKIKSIILNFSKRQKKSDPEYLKIQNELQKNH